MKHTEELRGQRAKLVADWQAILNTAEGEKRALNADERTKVEKIEADIDALKATIDAREKVEALDRAIVPESQRGAVETSVDQKAEADERTNAFWAYIRSGRQPESRVLSVATDTKGGYTVPDEFRRQLIEGLEMENVLRKLATVFTTTSGQMSIPVLSAHASAAWTAEAAAFNESDPTFAEVVLNAYKATVLAKASEEVLNDSAFDIAGIIARDFARAAGRLEEAAFVNGDGSGKPTGVIGGSGLGKTATATNAIVVDEIMDLHYALGRAYRQRATWLMHDATIKAVRKLKTGVSGDNTYLWQAGLREGEPDTLLGRPVVASQDVPEIATGNKVAIFGDFSYYYVGDRQAIGVQRLNELYSANGQVGFRLFKRTDGKVALAEAFKHLIMA
jgi:HK97 family phage major capsid protein